MTQAGARYNVHYDVHEEWHASERARLAARGDLPSFADGQIAAIARVHDLTLVRDFRRFRDLRVESWA